MPRLLAKSAELLMFHFNDDANQGLNFWSEMALRFIQCLPRWSVVNGVLTNVNIKRLSSVPRVTLYTKVSINNCLNSSSWIMIGR